MPEFVNGQRVRILKPQTHAGLPAGTEGEIEVGGCAHCDVEAENGTPTIHVLFPGAEKHATIGIAIERIELEAING